MLKQIICKSCRLPAHVDGDEITCEKCGTTFVRQGDTVRPTQIGRLDKIEKDVAELADIIKTNIGPAPAQKPDKDNDQDYDKDDDW